MRMLMGAVALTAMMGTGAAYAQSGYSRLDHDVQKMWDDTFHPEQRGSSRTDWERRRDAEHYAYERDRRREAERADWCRSHPGGCGGGPGYGNYYGR
jgi:hypothetical protein